MGVDHQRADSQSGRGECRRWCVNSPVSLLVLSLTRLSLLLHVITFDLGVFGSTLLWGTDDDDELEEEEGEGKKKRRR